MPDVQKLAPRNPNALQFALYTGTLPTTWLTMIPKDSISVSDSIGTATYPDFGTALGALAAMAPDGQRTVSITFTAYLIPGDVAFETAFAAYKATDQVAFREQVIARDGAETFSQVYAGFLTSFGRNQSRDGVAEVSVTFSAAADITPVTP